MRHPPDARIALAALIAVILVVYWPLLLGLVNQWASDDSASHGFLVVPLAAWFAWRRRGDLKQAAPAPSGWGLPVVLAALCLWAAGTAAAELFVARASFVLLIAGCILFLFGIEWMRVLAFPTAFLVLMIPLPEIVFNQIALPLQLFASEVGETALRAGGVPVLRDGNVLELVGARLEVAEACSGIRSIVALLTFALAAGHVGGWSGPRLLLLAVSTIPIAVLANATRVAATGFAAEAWGPVVTEGALHTAAGAAVFVAGVLALVALERLMRPRYVTAVELIGRRP